MIAGELRLPRLLFLEAIDHLAGLHDALAVLVAHREIIGGADPDHGRLAGLVLEHPAASRRMRGEHLRALACNLVGGVDDLRELARGSPTVTSSP